MKKILNFSGADFAKIQSTSILTDSAIESIENKIAIEIEKAHNCHVNPRTQISHAKRITLQH